MKKLPETQAPDDDAWNEVLKGIKKLPSREEKPCPPLIINDIKPSINYAEAYSGDCLSELKVGSVDNIDKRTAEKFKRGDFVIQKTLDLHGYFEKEAFEAVEEFIKTAYMQKLRCVLIITGKGIKKETDEWYEKKGILKESVPNWLNTPQIRPLILSFSYARPEDGGEGALYVLLRRHRNS